MNYGLRNMAFGMATTPHDIDIAGAADTQIDGTAYDMLGYNGIIYSCPIIASTGDSTAEYLQIVGLESNSSGGTFVSFTTAFAVRGVSTAAAACDDMLVVVDYYKPKDRWQKPRITGSTGVFRGACQAIRYGTREGPVTQTTGTDHTKASGVFATPTTA